MYFFELLDQADLAKSMEIFLSKCTESPDIDSTRAGLEKVIGNLKALEPNIDDSSTICIVSDGEDESNPEHYDEALLICEGDEQSYCIMAAPWADVAGYRVDEESLSQYEKEYIVALVLWEITWLGFDEETIQKQVESWNEGNE